MILFLFSKLFLFDNFLIKDNIVYKLKGNTIIKKVLFGNVISFDYIKESNKFFFLTDQGIMVYRPTLKSLVYPSTLLGGKIYSIGHLIVVVSSDGFLVYKSFTTIKPYYSYLMDESFQVAGKFKGGILIFKGKKAYIFTPINKGKLKKINIEHKKYMYAYKNSVVGIKNGNIYINSLLIVKGTHIKNAYGIEEYYIAFNDNTIYVVNLITRKTITIKGEIDRSFLSNKEIRFKKQKKWYTLLLPSGKTTSLPQNSMFVLNDFQYVLKNNELTVKPKDSDNQITTPISSSYQIQIGAFSSKENALHLISQYKNFNLPIFILEEQGLYRVRLGNFISKKDAMKTKELLNKGWVINASTEPNITQKLSALSKRDTIFIYTCEKNKIYINKRLILNIVPDSLKVINDTLINIYKDNNIHSLTIKNDKVNIE